MIFLVAVWSTQGPGVVAYGVSAGVFALLAGVTCCCSSGLASANKYFDCNIITKTRTPHKVRVVTVGGGAEEQCVTGEPQ